MDWEHGGMELGEPSGDNREFRRMMDAVGGEGLRQIIEHLTGKIEADPDDTESLALRGLAYGELGDHLGAAQDYYDAIRLAPGDAVAHYSRGACKAQLGNLAEAASDFEVAIILSPDDADAYYDRGLTYGETGEPLLAVEDLSRVLELEPDLAVA